MLEVLDRAVSQEKKNENKKHPNFKGRSKTVFADVTTLHLENPRVHQKKKIVKTNK